MLEQLDSGQQPQLNLEYRPEYPEFQHWPKIPRLSKESCVITEKIDGTNGIIFITDSGQVLCGSRNRWLRHSDSTVGGANSDNYGFRAWVDQNQEQLQRLGKGFHYGEWYGLGIQRGYGLTEKRFALFNGRDENLPSCVSKVPWLYSGPFNEKALAVTIEDLRTNGSKAVPGFMKPEGIVVHLREAGKRYKVLLENDSLHKGQINDDSV